MEAVLPLTMVSAGRQVTLVRIEGGRGLRAKLTDMGLNEGIRLKVVHSHRHGPCIVLAGNTRLVLGHGMAQKVMVREE